MLTDRDESCRGCERGAFDISNRLNMGIGHLTILSKQKLIDSSRIGACFWLPQPAHIKSIANVKIIFPSSKISLVQENIIDTVHMHLLTKLLCRKRHKKTKDAESKKEMNLIMCNNVQ